MACRVQVSASKKPLHFYVELAKVRFSVLIIAAAHCSSISEQENGVDASELLKGITEEMSLL